MGGVGMDAAALSDFTPNRQESKMSALRTWRWTRGGESGYDGEQRKSPGGGRGISRPASREKEDVMEDKAAIRSRMRKRRTDMAPEEVWERSLAAQRHILETDEWKRARSVGLYCAIRNETDTALLLDTAWAEGKETFLPHTQRAGIMDFFPCLDRQNLVRNAMGIPEPNPAACPLPPEGGWVPSLIIVPGVAFDRHGHRLGMAGGYYDRYFARPSTQNVFRMAIAYAFQVVESLPADLWDAPVHAIATEEGVLWL